MTNKYNLGRRGLGGRGALYGGGGLCSISSFRLESLILFYTELQFNLKVWYIFVCFKIFFWAY